MKTVMSTVKVSIEGICPLKMDRFVEENNSKTKEEYKAAAENKCYRTEKGELAIPSNAIKAVIRAASSELGKKMEGKKNRQMIAAGVFPKETMISLGKTKHDGICEDLVTRPGTGDKVTRVITYRPIIKEWEASFELNLIGVEASFVKQALELGGLKYGLLGHRPEFGRFMVTKFKEV
jgi:hypothetical protein